MQTFIIFNILSLFHIVNSFAVTYSECHRQSLKNKEKVCNGNGKCHIFFGCQCFDGFMGENCEIKTEKRNGCYLNKCFEGSKCIEISANQYYCECPENRFGNFCEFEDPCFACIEKCFEIDEDVFECDELGKNDKKIINHTTNLNITVSPSNDTSTINQTECVIADYCQNITENNVCDFICNTELCNFDFNDCNFISNISTTVPISMKESKNDEIYQYLYYLVAVCLTIFTFIILLLLGKLILKRWKKISAEIEAENAAIREMYFKEPTYFTI